MQLCIAHRLRTIADVDGSSSKEIDLTQLDSDDDDVDAILNRRGPSAEALAKINDYCKCVHDFAGAFTHSMQ